ncbi:MAG: phytanoyl-CoA dioxygenase family protein [Planctomycetaceae bacterium]|nr:phytanoyl-CoA dioxygenase family protein [Planctomycetaceae bacterium]
MSTPVELATDEVVAHYRREGYAIIRGLLTDPELTRLREVFGELETMPNVVDRFAKRLVVTRNLWRTHPDLKPLVWTVGRVAARLLGQSGVRLVDDVALVKPSRHDGGDPTIWHQDAPNFPFDRRGFLTVWIAVNDVSLDQGPLTFVPRSHRLGLLGAVDGGGEEVGLEALLRPDDYAYIGNSLTTALSAGDASVHDGLMLHAAGPNLTDRPRLAWGVRFIPSATLYTGGAHRAFDNLGLKPFEPFDHPNFPLIE